MHCFPERKHTIYIFFQSTQPQQVLRQGIRIHHNGAWKFQVSYLSSSGPMAIYETLKNIDTLFRADDLPTTWDQQKLENFQNIVYHQIEKSKCSGHVPALCLKEKSSACFHSMFTRTHRARTSLWLH
uniref:Uncharacterized protein n=1 Tax=Oncorhynchus kisutch TaxID=8019 RepID=A0A8C7FQN7_ONCKI